MKIDNQPDGTFAIRASREDLVILNNALNEICNGLSVPDFETRVGAPLASAERLLEIVGAALDRYAAH